MNNDLFDNIKFKEKIKAEDTIVYQPSGYEGIKINDDIYLTKNIKYFSTSIYGILIRYKKELLSFEKSSIQVLEMI